MLDIRNEETRFVRNNDDSRDPVVNGDDKFDLCTHRRFVEASRLRRQAIPRHFPEQPSPC